MKRTHVAFFVMALPVVLASLQAVAQTYAAPQIPESAYRTGQPLVLPPPQRVARAPEPVEKSIFNQTQFSIAYAKAGKPTMVVLWNRELSDMLSQTSNAQLSVDRSYNSTRSGNSLDINSNTTITAGNTTTQQALRDSPEERINLQLRSAYMQTLSAAGVRLVDRNLVMRKIANTQVNSKSKTKDELDSQMVEMDAFGKHAKLLMEVLNTPDKASPSGWSTYISIKNLNDGVVLTEGYSAGRPHAQATAAEITAAMPAPIRFEPDPRGGFRQVIDVPKQAVLSLETPELGRRIAEETLQRLSVALLR